jgi:hypothetical protein
MATTPRFEPLAINTLHHHSSVKQYKPIFQPIQTTPSISVLAATPGAVQFLNSE